MKNLFFTTMVFIGITGISFAAAPITTCPTGYVTVREPAINLADSTCSSNYTNAGTAESCLVAVPAGVCMMFIPTDMEFTDDYGTYHYATICPLTDD